MLKSPKVDLESTRLQRPETGKPRQGRGECTTVKGPDQCRLLNWDGICLCELLNTPLEHVLKSERWTRFRVGKCTDVHHRCQTKFDLPEAYLSRVATSQPANRLNDQPASQVGSEKRLVPQESARRVASHRPFTSKHMQSQTCRVMLGNDDACEPSRRGPIPHVDLHHSVPHKVLTGSSG